MCKPIDISKFGVVYAAAQKNLGIAGMTIVIIRDDLLGSPAPQTPTVYNYTLEAEQRSLYPTPPTFAWYMASLMCDWMIEQGGIETLYQRNVHKAEKLYHLIDHSKGFYFNSAPVECRSRMNVTFRLRNPLLEKTFLDEATQHQLGYLAGHKLAGGGMRASIYNAVSEESVDRLIIFMKNFQSKYEGITDCF
jgi:phosphoserine aminotransferase